VRFEERQRFLSAAVAVVLVVLLAMATLASWNATRAGLPASRQLLMFLPLAVVIPLLGMELQIAVDTAGVHVRMFPFAKRTIAPAQIAQWEARTYRPIREYGGWGVRFGPRGRAYNVSGNRGVELTLADGRRLMIGSRRADELAAAIAALKRA
jgi:hypothetical protein